MCICGFAEWIYFHNYKLSVRLPLPHIFMNVNSNSNSNTHLSLPCSPRRRYSTTFAIHGNFASQYFRYYILFSTSNKPNCLLAVLLYTWLRKRYNLSLSHFRFDAGFFAKIFLFRHTTTFTRVLYGFVHAISWNKCLREGIAICLHLWCI